MALIIESTKTKKPNTSGTLFDQIFKTKIGWLFICLFLTLVFGILSNWFDWAEYAMFVSLVYPVVLSIIMLIYAWIINPLKGD